MKKVFLNKKFSATGIGSLPFDDAKDACLFTREVFKDDIIFWPQLVKRSFLENMYVQFSEGLPAVRIDKDKKRIYVDTQSEDYQKQLELSLEHYLNNDLDYFAISRDYAKGLYAMLEDKGLSKNEYFKGQITGPISFGLTIKQENDHSIIYNPELYQALVKLLCMKARWQIEKFKTQSAFACRSPDLTSGRTSADCPQEQSEDGQNSILRQRSGLTLSEVEASKLRTIIFIDEPYLVSVGSSFVSLKKEDIIKDLDEMIGSIHQEGALAGIHCCGNTDWSILLKTKIDILSFDAYNFLDNLLIFHEELKPFLKNGGMLAWGIVPTSEKVNEEGIENNLLEIIKNVAKKNKLFDNQTLITPSCGCGTLSLDLAKKIHILTVRITEQLNRNKV